MSTTTVGFVGVGRLGFPLACALLEAGFPVVCTHRGKAEELVARGARIPGDGSVCAVAQAADVVATCLPSLSAFEEVTTGVDGILSADEVPPLIELSTLALQDKEKVRALFADRGVELFDAPVSGTPQMAAAKMAVIYASGDREAHARWEHVFTAMSPAHRYVGPFGLGTKFKLVAQFLVLTNAMATVEAMAYAELAGLDLHQVAELISASPGATSGQFNVRAPLIAARRFEGRLVTVDMLLKDLNEVTSYGREIGAPVDLLAVIGERYRELAAAGEGGAEPAKLFDTLLAEAGR